MDEPIGTVVREDHRDGGYSIWVHGGVAAAVGWTRDEGTIRRVEPRWTCVHSTVPHKHGDWASVRPSGILIGSVPGTPAFEASVPAAAEGRQQ
jgi:hypothetical protein